MSKSHRRLNLLRTTPFGRVATDFPITAIDVGSRYGFEADLDPIAFAVDGIGFEPDPEEFARLRQRVAHEGCGPLRSLRHFPTALSGTGGMRTLHIPSCADSSSLLEHDPNIGAAFQKMHMFRVDKTLPVETMTLDAAATKFDILNPAYLKIDIEGAELEVFTAGTRVLEDLLAIKTEVSFIPFRRGQPLASDVDIFLRRHGFLLMDLVAPYRWRRGAFVAHPQTTGGAVPYSRGQLAHGDFLYFRDPDTIGPGPDAASRLIRTALLCMTHGYFDHALAFLARPEATKLLHDAYGLEVPNAVRTTSLVFGRVEWRAHFAEHLRRIVTFARSVPHIASR